MDKFVQTVIENKWRVAGGTIIGALFLFSVWGMMHVTYAVNKSMKVEISQ